MTDQAQSIVDVMYERHSVRKFSNQEISQEQLEKIVQAAGSAPSAWNLQHWKFVLVKDQGLKEQLCEAAFGQQQVKDAAILVVVLGDTQANLNAEEIYSTAVSAGFMPETVKNNILSSIKNAYETVPNIGVYSAFQNSAFAAMQLMLAAKAGGIDSCPMSGFDPQAVRRILEIPERYLPVLFIPLGYPVEPAHGSGRFPLERILVHNKF